MEPVPRIEAEIGARSYSSIRIFDGAGVLIAMVDPITRIRTSVDGSIAPQPHATQDVEVYKAYPKTTSRRTMPKGGLPPAVIHTKNKLLAAGETLTPTVLLRKR